MTFDHGMTRYASTAHDRRTMRWPSTVMHVQPMSIGHGWYLRITRETVTHVHQNDNARARPSLCFIPKKRSERNATQQHQETSKPRCLYRPLLRSGTGMSYNHLLITLLNIIKLSSPSLFNRDSTTQPTHFRSRRTQPIAITIQMCGLLHRERWNFYKRSVGADSAAMRNTYLLANIQQQIQSTKS